MGNTVLKTESEFDDETPSNSGGDCLVVGIQTHPVPRLSTWSDISPSFEDAVSITTDSTPTTTEYESANENDVKSTSPDTDILSSDLSMETKSLILTTSSDVRRGDSVSTAVEDVDSESADYVQKQLHPTPEPTLWLAADSASNGRTLSGHRFVAEVNHFAATQPQCTDNVQLQPSHPNQSAGRSRDRGHPKARNRHEDASRRRPPTAAASASTRKSAAKQSRHVVQHPSKKKPTFSSHKNVTQRSPVVFDDFFVFSYRHVFKEVVDAFSDPEEARLSPFSCENRQAEKMGLAVSETIVQMSQLLDEVAVRRCEPRVELVPHSWWTWFLNGRAAYPAFFDFCPDNVHILLGEAQPLVKVKAYAVLRIFARPEFVDSLTGVRFVVVAHERRLVYVVDASERVAQRSGGQPLAVNHLTDGRSAALLAPPENACRGRETGWRSEGDGRVDGAVETENRRTDGGGDHLSAAPLSATSLEARRPSSVHAATDDGRRIRTTIDKWVDDRPPSPPEPVLCAAGRAATNLVPLSDQLTLDSNDSLRNGQSVKGGAGGGSSSSIDSNATGPEPVIDERRRFSSSSADGDDEFDSCADSLIGNVGGFVASDGRDGDCGGGGTASESWSDTCCSLPGSENFSSLRSDIVECAFQLDSINSETMNCNENVSEAGPATAADFENINNIPFLNDSSEYDFISKVGGTGLVAENLRKQSLYVKFDPLLGGEADSLPLNGTLKLEDTLDSSKHETSLLRPNNEENRTNEHADSSGCENGSVGKLISVTPNRSPRKITPKSSPRFPETDPDDVSKLQSLLLKQMKKEEAFKEEIEFSRRDYEQVLQKFQNAEKEIVHLKTELESTQENERKLKNDLKERIKSKQQLSVVMGEYEKTISQMLTKRDEEKKEFEATIKKVESERDSTVQHLNNLENAFNDIHQKYERGKVVNEALKKNEELLQKSINEYETTVKTVENKYELLKSHATSQLEKANQELELITQSYEKEQAKLKAMLRKSEIQINSLQNALDRKTKENQELTAICDELIVKLSSHSNA